MSGGGNVVTSTLRFGGVMEAVLVVVVVLPFWVLVAGLYSVMERWS